MKEEVIKKLQSVAIGEKKESYTAIHSGARQEEEQIEFLSTGVPDLDADLGGGIPVGRFIEIFGLPSSAKSGLAYHILANAQRKGGIAILIDTEDSYVPEWAAKNGIDVDELQVATAPSLEKLGALVDQVINVCLQHPDTLSVIVIDSLSAPPSEEELDLKTEELNKQVAIRARVITKLIQRWVAKLNRFKLERGRHRVTIIAVNHAKQQIVGHGFTTPGGFALKYFSAVRIMLQQKGRRGKSGIYVKARVVKNKIAPPYGEAEFAYLFDGQIVPINRKKSSADEQAELMDEDIEEEEVIGAF